MHVFLTGDRQVGKSRAIARTAAAMGRPVYGFRTRFLTRERGSSSLYMVPAAEADTAPLEEDNMVAALLEGKMRGLTERFDTLGTALLREARRHPEGLILMDECGHLEKHALAFQREIAACLDGDIPVLGVLRKDQAWHDFIKNHPNVRVITVTPENRTEIDGEILSLLREGAE